jgi:hypothetical protein
LVPREKQGMDARHEAGHDDEFDARYMAASLTFFVTIITNRQA